MKVDISPSISLLRLQPWTGWSLGSGDEWGTELLWGLRCRCSFGESQPHRGKSPFQVLSFRLRRGGSDFIVCGALSLSRSG